MSTRPLVIERTAHTLVIDRSKPSGIAVERQILRELVIQRSGLPGPAGAGSAPHIHTQASAASLWTVNHNLGFRPVVTVLSAGGVAVDADVLHLSTNQVQILFNTPQTGQAIAR